MTSCVFCSNQVIIFPIKADLQIQIFILYTTVSASFLLF